MTQPTRPSEPHISRDADGFLDEVFASGIARLHFEAMGEAQFWMSFILEDGREFDINCGAINPRAKGYSRIEEDS